MSDPILGVEIQPEVHDEWIADLHEDRTVEESTALILRFMNSTIGSILWQNQGDDYEHLPCV